MGGNLLIMDINALPRDHGMSIEQWGHLLTQNEIVFYDSEKGKTPFFMSETDETKVKLMDVQEEETLKELERILTAEENEIGDPIVEVIDENERP